MAEHRRYCGEILQELRGYATAGLQQSRSVGVDAVQSAAEEQDSDTEMVDLDETMAVMQMLQEEVRVLQEDVGNIRAEVQWVAQGRESKAQVLQREVECLSDELKVLQGSAVEGQVLSKVAADVRVMMEGLEQEQMERLVGVEQLGGSLAQRVEGCEVNFHSTMARFQERMLMLEG